MKPRPRVVEVVAVEVVDHGRQRAGADEGVEDLVVEEHVDRRHGLVGVVLADHAFAGLRVVGLADARQQQQAHVLQDVGREDHHLGRLEELLAGAVDVGDAGGALACRASSSTLQHFALGLQGEVGLAHQVGQDRGLRAGLGVVAAAELLAEAAIGAGAQLRAQRVGVGLRQVAGRVRKGMVAEARRGLAEQRRAHRSAPSAGSGTRSTASPSNGLPPGWISPFRLPALPLVPQSLSNAS